MEINKKAISTIIAQRQSKILDIDLKIEHVKQMRKNIAMLNNYFLDAEEESPKALMRVLEDYPEIKEYYDTIDDKKENTILSELCSEYETLGRSLESLKVRFSRNFISVGFLGARGTGKSTLLKTISGILPEGPYDKCIPTAHLGSCTGTVIYLEHDQDIKDQGTVYAYIKFKSAEAIINEMENDIRLIFGDSLKDDINIKKELKNNLFTGRELTPENKQNLNKDLFRHLTFETTGDSTMNLSKKQFLDSYIENYDKWIEYVGKSDGKYAIEKSLQPYHIVVRERITEDNLTYIEEEFEACGQGDFKNEQIYYRCDNADEISKFVTYHTGGNNVTYYRFPAVEKVIIKANLVVGHSELFQFADTMALNDYSNTQNMKRIADEFERNVDAAIILISATQTGRAESIEDIDPVKHYIESHCDITRINENMAAVINFDPRLHDMASAREETFKTACPEIYNTLKEKGNIYLIDAKRGTDVQKAIESFLETLDIDSLDKGIIEKADNDFKMACTKYKTVGENLNKRIISVSPNEMPMKTEKLLDNIRQELKNLQHDKPLNEQGIWKIDAKIDEIDKNWTKDSKHLREVTKHFDTNYMSLLSYVVASIERAANLLSIKVREQGHLIDENLKKSEADFKLELAKAVLNGMKFDVTKLEKEKEITQDDEDFFDKLGDFLFSLASDDSKTQLLRSAFKSANEFKLTDMTAITKKLFDKYSYENINYISCEDDLKNIDLKNMVTHDTMDLSKISEVLQNRIKDFCKNMKEKTKIINEVIPDIKEQKLHELHNFAHCFEVTIYESTWKEIFENLYKMKYIIQNDDNLFKRNQIKLSLKNSIDDITKLKWKRK